MAYKVDIGCTGSGPAPLRARRLRLERLGRHRLGGRFRVWRRRLRRLADVRAGAGADALSAGREACPRSAAEAGLVDQYARADRVPAGDPWRGRLRDQQVREWEGGAAAGSEGLVG